MKKICFLAALSVWLALPLAAQTKSQQTFTITVDAPACALAVNLTPAPPNGTADGITQYGPYTFTATENSSCVNPLKWSVVTGTFPAGLTLSTGGVLSGTIATTACTTYPCSFPVTVQVMDSGTTTTTFKIDMALPKKKEIAKRQ